MTPTTEDRGTTRDRVITAARGLFLERGYVATRVDDIAAGAGVALGSVYNVGRSKADLLLMVLEDATAGYQPVEPPAERASFASPKRPRYEDLAAETDPVRRVQWIAGRIAGIAERVAPLWGVLVQAAGVDPKAAAHLEASLHRRQLGLTVAVEQVPDEQLRAPREEIVDSLFAISAPEIYLRLRSLRGWTHADYHDWLERTLLIQFLATPT